MSEADQDNKALEFYKNRSAFFQDVFENINASVVIVDQEGGIISGNSVYRSIVSLSNLELLGVKFSHFMSSPQEKKEWYDLLGAMNAGIFSAKMTCHLSVGPGKFLFFELSINPISNGENDSSYFVITGVDRTGEEEAKAREKEAQELVQKNMEELKEYSSYVNNIIELSPIGIWVIQYMALEERERDPEYEWHVKVGARPVITHVNQEITKMLGFRKGELIGRSVFDAMLVDSGAANAYLVEIKNRRNNRPGSYETELKVKGGGRVPVLIKAIPTQVEEGSGKVVESVGMILDLTERRESEMKIADMNEKLMELNKRLENSNTYLQKIAVTDQLTGVANRRGFEEFLGIEWEKAVKTQSELSLILFDIDYFKAFNDLYGHVEGDLCLTMVADAAHDALKRSNDYLSRYGGEEFMVVLPATNLEGAKKVAENLCQTIRQLKVPHEKSSVAKVVTISLGVVSVPVGGEIRMEQAIQMADKALYEAKESGRNQVRVYGEGLLNKGEIKNELN